MIHHKTVKSVGVRQLKSRLSEYLRLVRSGEVELVTDRDEVVAELRPARRQFGAANSVDELLDSLAERGELTRAGLSKHRWKWKARGLGLAGGSAITILDELSGER
jgi:antitoxin (DNA-binding transcriptional repressor) of toxin-antitoxin stability system